MPGAPTFEADHWRIRSDTEAAQGGTPSWETTEDQAAALSWDIGTTFRIRLPADATPQQADKDTDAPPMYIRPMNVMVVDDDVPAFRHR